MQCAITRVMHFLIFLGCDSRDSSGSDRYDELWYEVFI